MSPLRLPDDRDVLIGDRFKLLAYVDEGGQAEVWRAIDMDTGSLAAVKLFTGRLSARPDFHQRLEREVRHAQDLAAAGVAVVGVIDQGDDDGFAHVPYIAMDWMPGKSVKALIEEHAGPLPVGEVARVIFEAAQALDGVHDMKCLHRDISPANLLFDAARHVHVSDFGIARGELDETITDGADGSWFGKAAYMAPESFRNAASAASDRYSLAVIAFEMLAGRRPLTSQQSIAAADPLARRAIPSLHAIRPELPPGIDKVFERGLARSPAEREEHYPDARLFAGDLVGSLIGTDANAATGETVALDGQDVTRVIPWVKRANDRRSYRAGGWRRRLRDDLRSLVDAAKGIAADAEGGHQRLRARAADWVDRHPWALPVAVMAAATVVFVWFATSTQGLVVETFESLPGPVRWAVAVALLALSLQAVAGIPTGEGDRTGFGVLTFVGAVLLIELWSTCLDERSGASPAVALAATAAAFGLAALWRSGRHELVARIGLSALALCLCIVTVELELRFVTEWLWAWQDVDLERFGVAQLEETTQAAALLVAAVVTLRQATRVEVPQRNIVTVPWWAALLTSSICLIAWALVTEGVADPLGPYLGTYLIVCAVVLVALAPLLTWAALAVQRRFRSHPSRWLVWLAVAAWAIALITLEIAALGPDRAFEDYLSVIR